MKPTELKLGYRKEDLISAQHLLAIYNAKLMKAIESDNFAEACSAIRAIEAECEHASRIAATLSFKSRNATITPAPRINRGTNTEVF